MDRKENEVQRSGGFFFFFLFLAAILSACGGGGGATEGGPVAAAGSPCPDAAPGLGATGGAGSYLFYKGCGLWAVDPERPAGPARIESDFVSASFQTIVGGNWDVGAGKVTGRNLRYLVYAKADGRLYKVSALKSDPLTPVQVSSETEASSLCSATTLPDYSDPNRSLYIYVMPGPDQSCGAADDNIQKIVRIGMGPSESPISVPHDRSQFIDYEAPLAPGAVPGSSTPNDLAPVIDLVDKNGGGLAGWLATIDRNQKALPALVFTADAGSDTLTTPYNHGFSEGTRVQVASTGGLPGGLDSNRFYYVHLTSSNSFKLYRITKREVTEKNREGNFEKVIKLEGGKGTLKDKDINEHRHRDGSNPHAGEAIHQHGPGDQPHIDEGIIDLTTNGSGTMTIQRVASYTDLYRCDPNLANCNVLKQTEFMTACKVSGDNQKANSASPAPAQNALPAPFAVSVSDFLNNPKNGVAVSWGADGGGVITASASVTAGGQAWATGAIVGTPGAPSTFAATVAGFSGAPLTFLGSTQPLDPSPPSCKVEKSFFIANISAPGYGDLFAGRMVLRFDLQFKPDPNNPNPALANKESTKGALYTYDIASNTLSADPKYTSLDGFPEGLLSIADGGSFFFADQGRLYRLPLDGGADASLLADEGKRFVQMETTTNRVVYSLIDLEAQPPVSSLKTIPKGGFPFPTTLLSGATAFLLPVITAGDLVYFQTLGAASEAGVASTVIISREDGSGRTETANASLAGRTDSKVFVVLGCDITFSCPGGTLLSVDAPTASNDLTLGNLPADLVGAFFSGFGNAAMGEGEGGAESNNVDILYVKADQAGSLVRVTNTPSVQEEVE